MARNELRLAQADGARPAGARAVKVKVGELDEADEVFTKLMGDEVEPRREFIQTNALAVENLDF